jgi:hypothetical protein
MRAAAPSGFPKTARRMPPPIQIEAGLFIINLKKALTIIKIYSTQQYRYRLLIISSKIFAGKHRKFLLHLPIFIPFSLRTDIYSRKYVLCNAYSRSTTPPGTKSGS